MAGIEEIFRKALARHRAGEWAAAEAGYRRVLAESPDLMAAYTNLGDTLIGQGRFGEARDLLEEAVERAPDHIEARVNLANAQRLLGQWDAAAAGLEAVIARKPYFVEAIGNLALVEGARGREAQARALFEQALDLDPLHAENHYNYANLLAQTGQEGIAEAHFRKAIGLRPEMGEAHNNLGSLLKAQERWAEAEAAFEEAARATPRAPEAQFNLGVALQIQGKTAAADRALDRACALTDDTAFRLRRATLLPIIADSGQQIAAARDQFFERVSALAATEPTLKDPLGTCDWTNFYLAYHGGDDRPLQEAVAALLIAACPDLAEDRVDSRRPGAGAGPIRLGVASTYFRDHTIGALFKGLIGALARSDIDLHVFQIGPADDPVAAQIRGQAPFYTVLPRDLAACRAALADAALDVLFYPDIGMDAATYYLAFARLAPIQMVGWGHPVTTGIANVDIFVSADIFDTTGAEAHYSERLLRLPRLLSRQERPRIDLHAKSKSALGLPEDGTAYFCPQSLFKFHPDFDPILAEILGRNESATLCLLSGHRPHWNELLMARFRRTLGALSDRVRFIPNLNRDDFVRAQAMADVVLDTPHFSGGKTSLECLAAGTPLVTLPSGYLRGRLTYGFYELMGLSDCIAESAQDYADIAVRLGTDRDARHETRRRILARADCLFDDTEIVRIFVDRIRELVRDWPSTTRRQGP
ncbi:MAG: tetratricopeptide repeat protein [Alphaproteobacteria bacterium]|nr:tetratricopeptide repeat protein [Alphaproteobacteria bacterium]MDP6516622.1 tetratricopeptide repeat protein [Alphaproteobacteria bacterium]